MTRRNYFTDSNRRPLFSRDDDDDDVLILPTFEEEEEEEETAAHRAGRWADVASRRPHSPFVT